MLLCICSKVFQSKIGWADVVELRGENSDLREFLEAVKCSMWCGEESNYDDIGLIHPMVLQHIQRSNYCSTTL